MIGPKIGEHDEFEGLYTEKFRSLARPFGEFIKYERDRAAIDVGIHLTEKTNRRFRSVSNTRTWFQLKGIRATTLSLPEFERRSDVALDLDIDDLRFWYASPEAVYLAVYVESADLFLAEDIRDIVDRQWGEDVLNVSTFRAEQNRARVRILKSAVLDDEAWRRMLSHRSLRIDGPAFRGRPLGHRLDPLRSIPNKMEPAVFAQVVNRLLSVHRYEIVEELDPTIIFPQAKSQNDHLSLTLGTMNHTYEWVLQLTTEFGFNKGSDFRIEGTPYHVQGICAVLIHSDKRSYPEMRAVREMANELEGRRVRHLLVFANEYDDPGYFGSFFGAVRETRLSASPNYWVIWLLTYLLRQRCTLSFETRYPGVSRIIYTDVISNICGLFSIYGRPELYTLTQVQDVLYWIM